MRLSNYHEVVGHLNSVKEEDGMLVLNFTIEKKIEVPTGSLQVSDLQNLVNESISIFNLGEKYKMKKIKNKEKKINDRAKVKL